MDVEAGKGEDKDEAGECKRGDKGARGQEGKAEKRSGLFYKS